VSQWKRKNKNTVLYHLIVPPNSTATLSLPKGYRLKKAQLDSGKKLSLQPEGETYSLPAGNYRMELSR
jgi:hypothetical protein